MVLSVMLNKIGLLQAMCVETVLSEFFSFEYPLFLAHIPPLFTFCVLLTTCPQ